MSHGESVPTTRTAQKTVARALTVGMIGTLVKRAYQMTSSVTEKAVLVTILMSVVSSFIATMVNFASHILLGGSPNLLDRTSHNIVGLANRGRGFKTEGGKGWAVGRK